MDQLSPQLSKTAGEEILNSAPGGRYLALRTLRAIAEKRELTPHQENMAVYLLSRRLVDFSESKGGWGFYPFGKQLWEMYSSTEEGDMKTDWAETAKRAAKAIKPFKKGNKVIHYNETSWVGDKSTTTPKVFKVAIHYPTKEHAMGPIPTTLLKGVKRNYQVVIAMDKTNHPYMFVFDARGHAVFFPLWMKPHQFKRAKSYEESTEQGMLGMLIEELRWG